jgi:hypothetical protein
LIKYAWPEDIWYHVDKESSAHVYIRLPKEEFDAAKKSGDKDWYKKIDEKVVEDCCQLVKANSIKGNKQDNVTVVFTPARYFFQSHNRVHACLPRYATRKNTHIIACTHALCPGSLSLVICAVFKTHTRTHKNTVYKRVEKRTCTPAHTHAYTYAYTHIHFQLSGLSRQDIT